LSLVCAGIKRDGGRCTQGVSPGEAWCYNHDPGRASERKRAASRAGKSKPSREVQDLKRQLEALTEQVIDGSIEPYPAAVAGQLIGVRLRLLEFERRLRETDEIAQQVEELVERFGA
jgi:hypothetical protein